MSKTPLSQIPEMPEGAKVLVMAGEEPVLLCRVQGVLRAVSNACPHRGGPLSEGVLEGYDIHCPLHGWSFDVRTGQCTSHPGPSLPCYALTTEGDQVFVDLPSPS